MNLKMTYNKKCIAINNIVYSEYLNMNASILSTQYKNHMIYLTIYLHIYYENDDDSLMNLFMKK